MRTCLYLLDMSVALKVETFKKDSVMKIKDNWGAISKAIKDTAKLLNQFGFNSENMISHEPELKIEAKNDETFLFDKESAQST